MWSQKRLFCVEKIFLYTRFISTHGLAISPIVREYTDTEKENRRNKKREIVTWDFSFYLSFPQP